MLSFSQQRCNDSMNNMNWKKSKKSKSTNFIMLLSIPPWSMVISYADWDIIFE